MGDTSMASISLSAGNDEAKNRKSPEIPRSQPRDLSPDSKDESQAEDSAASDTNSKPQAPMQKRRRVTRACDECRRKKIKCDGKQPCTHCTVYSYECTYDQPSNRRRNPAPQYIEALEQRLQKAESILRSVLPGVDLDDPKYDARGVDQILESYKNQPQSHAKKPQPVNVSKSDDEGQIQPMVDRVGMLDLDDQGYWDFHGHSSGYAFMRKFRTQFGDGFLGAARSWPKNRTISQMIESPKSVNSSPYEFNPNSAIDLPSKEIAIELCRNTIDDCCALMRPLHRPTFFRRLHSVYDTDPEQYTNDHIRFLPLLYVVMAVGCLFSKAENENTMLDLKGYKEATEHGYQYFNMGKQMVDITDCRDLMSIQTVFFMIIFLQSTAKLSTCYAYIGIGLRACCRLGLHRDLPNTFNPIETEERKRIFWLIRKIDTYVGAMLGLPQMLSEEDIDQQLPMEIHDDFILEDGVRPMPPAAFPLLKATNAHTKLTSILRKVVRYVYPIKGPNDSQKGLIQVGDNYTISHSRIRELEHDLQVWMDELPLDLRPSDNAATELSRVQQLLRMSYAHVQMMMYRPFIHYVSQAAQQGTADKRSYACAAACISVARNIVHITSEMKRRGLLVGAYWFVMYTTYFAILSLVFFVLENPESPAGKDILKDAKEGRDTLAGLAKRSMAADRCSASLTRLFSELPEKLKERRTSLQPNPNTSKKRPPPGSGAGKLGPHNSVPNVTATGHEPGMPPVRARTLPYDYLAKVAKRNSVPDQSSPLSFGDPHMAPNPQLMGLNNSQLSSPMSGSYDFSPHIGSTDIPDLKNVMFPSDNPFAYPNQPISMLESADSQFGFADPKLDSFSGSNENSMFSTPSSMATQSQMQGNSDPGQQFNLNSFQNLYGDNPSLAHQMAAQGRHFSAPMTSYGGNSSNVFNLSGLQDTSNLGGMNNNTLGQEDYWTQVNKGSRTGFTPGASVNLDELFGGEGWSGAWNEQFTKQ